MESDEAEHKTLEVLYQVVEASETKITFISSEQRLSSMIVDTKLSQLGKTFDYLG